MTSGAPWSVKGIDPKAREVAKDLARRSGMTLGEWLNRVILEDEGPEEVTSEAFFADRPARNLEAQRIAAAVRPGDDLARVISALDHLTARIEASEARTGQIVSGVEQSVRDALSRIEAAERDHVAVAARFEGAVEEVRGDHARVATQVLETEDRHRGALAALEQRLETAQAGADQALASLRQSFAALDGRIGAAGQGAAPGLDQRLEEIAAGLASRLEAARAEMAAKLAEAAQERFDSMETRLGAMAEQVAAGERRSSLAVERMGREVLAVAENLNRRV